MFFIILKKYEGKIEITTKSDISNLYFMFEGLEKQLQ